MTASHDPRFVARSRKLNQMVGANVRVRREDAGYSIEALAAELQVAAGTLMEWEAGAARIPAADLFNLSTLFSCTVTDLFDGALAENGEALDQDTADQISRALGVPPR